MSYEDEWQHEQAKRKANLEEGELEAGLDVDEDDERRHDDDEPRTMELDDDDSGGHGYHNEMDVVRRDRLRNRIQSWRDGVGGDDDSGPRYR